MRKEVVNASRSSFQMEFDRMGWVVLPSWLWIWKYARSFGIFVCQDSFPWDKSSRDAVYPGDQFHFLELDDKANSLFMNSWELYF